ncbi:MAG: hypothetical protein WCI18_07845 [Pseudomonadota bacterium]
MKVALNMVPKWNPGIGSQGRIHKSIYLLVPLLFIFTSCGRSEPVTEDAKVEEHYDIPNKKSVYPATTSDCENGTTLSWVSFGSSFFDRYCTSCHSSSLEDSQRSGAPTTSNFDSYGGMIKQRSQILLSAGTLKDAKMPPTNTVPLEERKALIEYLKCGAPE